MKNILIGAHVSIADGIEKSIQRSEEIGATAMQIFTKSSRTWQTTLYTQAEIQAFKDRIKNSPIKAAVSHASYLINLASSDPEIQAKSREALIKELKRAKSIGLDAVVLHPGAHVGNGSSKGISAVAHELTHALREVGGSVVVALETMAKQGTTLGGSFEELRAIYDECKEQDRLKFCLDLCHVHVAGYQITTQAGWNNTMYQFDKIIGLKKLAVIHCNDSLTAFGSCKDRHANIGTGTLAHATFKALMNDSRLSHVPKILETPEKENHLDHILEIEFLKNLVD